MPSDGQTYQVGEGTWTYLEAWDCWRWDESGSSLTSMHIPAAVMEAHGLDETDDGERAYSVVDHCESCRYHVQFSEPVPLWPLRRVLHRESPNYSHQFISAFRGEVDTDVMARLASLAVPQIRDGGNTMIMPCIRPRCSGFRRVSLATHEDMQAGRMVAVQQCSDCGRWSCVPMDELEGGHISSMAILGGCVGEGDPITAYAEICRTVGRVFEVMDRFPGVITIWREPRDAHRAWFGFDESMFGTTSEAHHIRARANLECFNSILRTTNISDRYGWRIASLTTISGDQITQFIDYLQRLAENPACILDEAKADMYREEIINAEWCGGEAGRYLRLVSEQRWCKQRDTGTLEDLGREFWQSLYNLTAKRLGLRTVIKRTGAVVFPTDGIMAGIMFHDIKRAWAGFAPGGADISAYFDAGAFGVASGS